MNHKHPNTICADTGLPALTRQDREKLLGQRGRIIWIYGLPGSGKTTLAVQLERVLHAHGTVTQILDGDLFRKGVARGLGFSEEDRTENIRRAAESARLFLQAGIVTICAFITPRRAHRAMVRRILGDDVTFVYLSAPLETCRARDPKGHYEQSIRGEIRDFTGVGAAFEPPAPGESLAVDTQNLGLPECVGTLLAVV